MVKKMLDGESGSSPEGPKQKKAFLTRSYRDMLKAGLVCEAKISKVKTCYQY